MHLKSKQTVEILSQKEIAEQIFDMTIKAADVAQQANVGQFISVYCNDKTKLLPRPISICEIDQAKGTIRLVYRVAGDGTKSLSKLKEQDTIEIMGPLGNGFIKKESKAFVIGGGIGIPPMLELSKQLNCKKDIILGYRSDLFLTEEFKQYGDVYVATEDGSVGTKGTVLDAIKEHALTADIIYACGPTPMLKALKEYALLNDMECYISMEERMACGIGACLACVCKSTEVDDHSNVKNKRVCKEGPVFEAREVDFS